MRSIKAWLAALGAALGLALFLIWPADSGLAANTRVPESDAPAPGIGQHAIASQTLAPADLGGTAKGCSPGLLSAPS